MEVFVRGKNVSNKNKKSNNKHTQKIIVFLLKMKRGQLQKMTGQCLFEIVFPKMY